MNKERLEEAKLMSEMLRAETRLPHDFPFDLVDWLIEQAELAGYFARKNGELNEFLNKYIEPKHLGKNVIDVAMDIIVKQSERVQELESDSYNAHLERLLDRKDQEIERYRAALEFYADRENYEPDHYDPDTHDYTSMIDHDKGATARKALEGERGGKQ